MGKKKPEEMAKQREFFVKGAKQINNISEEKALEVFAIMEQFAGYGFNRSHAVAYSVLAYQTAYLKANYTAEYMAALLSNSIGNIEKISEFLEECKNLGIQVLGPDINESDINFTVNQNKAIRFGLAAIKGAGEEAVQSIVAERKKNGAYKSIFDFIERQNLRVINKRVMEALAYAGCFDCFRDVHRAQYFFKEADTTGIEKLIRYAVVKQSEKKSAVGSLFSESPTKSSIYSFKLPDCPPWSQYEQLQYEKEVVGIPISAHPLDSFKLLFKGRRLKSLSQINDFLEKEIEVGGIVTEINIRRDRNGNEFALFALQDYSTTVNMAVFKETYLKTKHLLHLNTALYVRGKVKERLKSPGTYEVFPNEIKLLSELQENIQKLTLHIPLQMLSSSFLEELEHFVKQSTGKVTLCMSFYDDIEKVRLNMFSRKYRISATSDIVKMLSKFPGIDFFAV